MIVKLKPDNGLVLSLKEYRLSPDKEYVAKVVKRKWGIWYRIKCDDGYTRELSDNHFITTEEMRDRRLDDLGII